MCCDHPEQSKYLVMMYNLNCFKLRFELVVLFYLSVFLQQTVCNLH